MPEIRVVDIHNKEAGTFQLEKAIFEAPVNPVLLHEIVVMQRNNERQGTVSTKTRGLVSGGGKKPWKQKGTGRARSGSSRSPVWVGGGTTFGPQPRAYAYTIPRKKARVALYAALTTKFRENQITVLDKLEIPSQKTRDAAGIFRNLGILEGTLFVVSGPVEESAPRSMRNLPGVTTLHVSRLNVYDILRHKNIVFTKASAEALQSVLKGRESMS
jgi:large subunit ribosomal protein L4